MLLHTVGCSAIVIASRELSRWTKGTVCGLSCRAAQQAKSGNASGAIAEGAAPSVNGTASAAAQTGPSLGVLAAADLDMPDLAPPPRAAQPAAAAASAPGPAGAAVPVAAAAKEAAQQPRRVSRLPVGFWMRACPIVVDSIHLGVYDLMSSCEGV